MGETIHALKTIEGLETFFATCCGLYSALRAAVMRDVEASYATPLGLSVLTAVGQAAACGKCSKARGKALTHNISDSLKLHCECSQEGKVDTF